MKAITEKRPGAYIVGGEQAGQPEYYPLEVVRGGEGALWSAWKPSWREWWMMLTGAPVSIGILARQQPPIIVEVAPPPPKPEAGT